VGASISGMDIAAGLAGIAESPLTAVVRGRYHPYFFDYAFQNLHIRRIDPIARVDSKDGQRTVYFEDGSVLENVDHIIFGTGYSWTLHMLPDVEIRNNRVPGLYQHVFKQEDPTLIFVGAVSPSLSLYRWYSPLYR
jgi:hypothetical protein